MNENNPIYANVFRIAFSAFEAQLSFGIETPIVDDVAGVITGATQKNIADIRLNPALAKQLCLSLKQQIDDYENQFGPLLDFEPISKNMGE